MDDEAIDVLFRSFPNDDDLTFPLSRQIVLIPDLQHEFYPEFFTPVELDNRKRNFLRLASGCGLVATISQHAEMTIRERLVCNGAFVMSPSSQILDAQGESVSAEFAAMVERMKPYFYFPANIWKHKNHPTLLAAFDLFRKASPGHADHKLLLTGHQRGWDELARNQPTAGVHHIGFVSRPELVHLYRNAEALTFVSLFEGFGMPVLEAFGVGCPVVCSNTTSLPEVADGAALLCDPNDARDVADKMARIVSDAGLRAALLEGGKRRFTDYSWRVAAEHLRQAIRDVADGTAAKARLTLPATGVAPSGLASSLAPAPTDALMAASMAAPEPLPAAASAVHGPLVSIVTPSFNQGVFLKRTIESVLGQTYPNIEYIVMDGGSTDESLDILRSYGDRVRWISERDKGQTDAINKGLALCSGRILAYLNSDDTLELDAIERVVQAFGEDPGVGLIYGDANYIDVNDAVTGRYATSPYSFDRLVEDCCVCQPAAFWRAEVTETVGPFDEKLNYVMDYEYWLRIAKAGFGIRHLPVVLANSRLYPETKTMSARGKIYEEVFQVSKLHAGRVSRSYVQGYWDHRLHERRDFKARLLGRLPLVEKALVEFDAHRLSGDGRGVPSALRHVAGKTFRSVDARVRRRMKRSSVLAPLVSGVSGVFADNWLSAAVEMSPSAARNRKLVLQGYPVTDMRLTIEAAGQVLETRDLVAGRVDRIEFQGTAGTIRLGFSNSVVDGAGRPLSFHVQYTNCFSEDEI
ncbi:glycosyltransferase [Azospirillum formosense]|uniref:glycosyltransferase n=1 Tax=Azospirillum formosense TaxID=861533 RepID=UPI00338F91E9